jgi:arabinogalactan oligomer/maltooligosaccharide transport system substrate-binding protein
MTKKIFVPFTLLFIAALLMSACGAKPTPLPTPTEAPATATQTPLPTSTATPIPVTISFWEQDSQEGDALIDKLISDFEAANPNIIVKRTNYANVALRTQFLTASKANAAPEVIRVPNTFIGLFSQLDTVAPLNQLFDDKSLGQFLPGSLEAAKVGNTLWGIPDNYGGHLMLIYNKSLIATPPATFDDLITQAKALTTKDVQGFAYSLTDPLWGVGFYGAFGGWPLDANDKPQFNNQSFIDYLTYVQKLKSGGVVPKDCDYNCADTLMRSGKAAMIINGDWSLSDYATALGNNLGVAPVPSINGKPYTELTAGTYFMISKPVLDDPLKKDAVVKFITFMTSADAQKQWLTQLKRLPSNTATAQDPAITNDPILAGSMAALENGRGTPATPVMQCVWDAWSSNLERIMKGSFYPSDAATSAQKAADACVTALSQPTATPPTATATP